MSRHHILHLLGTAQPEGAGKARLVGALAKGLDPSRFTVHAWFLKDAGPLSAEVENQGAAVRFVKWNRGLRDLPGMLRFSRQLREQKFALVHQHEGGRAARWVVRFNRGSRILVHLHGRVLEERWTELAAPNIQGADLVIATSHAVASQVRDAPVHVVYPGVPVGQSPPPRLQEPMRNGENQIVGTAARLVPVKGLLYLIRAISLLRTQLPGVQLEIAGSGPEESALKEEVRTLHLEDCVRFLGWQNNLQPLLERCDIFVLPSLEEAFGIVLVEAMAAGLPVIATNVGGIPEIVEHGKTGLLVPPADPVSLAGQLMLLLTDIHERRRLGQAGWDLARQKFSQESMICATERIYEQLLPASLASA